MSKSLRAGAARIHTVLVSRSMIEVHKGNTNLAPLFEKSSWVLETLEFFTARMEARLKALRTNKSIVHLYIQVDLRLRFAAGPEAEIKVSTIFPVLVCENRKSDPKLYLRARSRTWTATTPRPSLSRRV